MPENAAAEGGFDLGANEAFGGGVGTGSVSPSAVGGAFGGGTAADFGGGGFSSPAAQAAAASNAISAAQSVFSNAGIQQGLLGLAANLSASHAPTAPSMSPGFTPEAAFGLGTPGLNASTGGFLGTTSSPDTAPSYGMPDVTGVNSMSPADVAAIGTQVDVDAAMNRGGLQSGNFGPGLPGGTVSSANLASGNTETVSTGRGGSVTSTPGSLESMSFGVPAGLLSASTSTPSQVATNMANDMSALSAAQAAAAQAVADAQQATAPSTNVSPGTIAQDAARSSAPAAATGLNPLGQLFSRNPNLPDYADRGLLGKLGMDLAMGLSINPFASREDQAAGLRGRGYSPAEISGYFGRTDATVAANQAATENGMGSRDFITDTQIDSFAMTLPQSQRMQFNQMDRAGKLRMYYQRQGY